MDETSIKALVTGFATVLFVIAVGLFLSKVSLVKDYASAISDKDSLSASLSGKEYEEPEITYADVVAMLTNGDADYYIVVDSKVYRPSTYKEAEAVELPPRKERYTKQLTYSETGNLLGIVFTGTD